MKNKFLLGLALASMIFTSCTEDGTSDIVFNITNTTTTGTDTGTDGDVFLSGTYTEDLTLDADTSYVLNGSLVMTDGTTLTIPAGTTIEALAAGSDVYIAISQGAKIVADGNASNPIVFTSNASSPQAGDWGGLILLGKAPINSVSGDATSTSEIAGLPYGGSISNDDSGSLTYVRIEYSGGSADGQSENNGLSLYGVGNGTQVSYIQVYKGKDDGVEFFGGSVNASFISVIDLEDDSIDWTEGYSGTLSDIYIQPIQNPTETYNSDKAFECDGYNDDFGNNSDFFSSPTVSNVTIIGVGSDNTFQDGSTTTSYEAIRLRRGTEGLFDNVLISGYVEAFDVDGNLTTDLTGEAITNDLLQVTNVMFTDIVTNFKNDTEVALSDADFYTEGAATGTDYSTWGSGWTN